MANVSTAYSVRSEDSDSNDIDTSKRKRLINEVLQMEVIQGTDFNFGNGFKNYIKQLSVGKKTLPKRAKHRKIEDEELYKLELLTILRDEWNLLPFGTRANYENGDFDDTTDVPLIFEDKPLDSQCIPCILCKDTTGRFCNIDVFLSHINEKHIITDLYVCHLCYHGFFDQTAYRSHVRTHGQKVFKNATTLTLMCEDCGGEFVLKPDQDKSFGDEYMKFILHHARSKLHPVQFNYHEKIPPAFTSYWLNQYLVKTKSTVKTFNIQTQAAMREVDLEANIARIQLLKALKVGVKGERRARQRGLSYVNESTKYEDKEVYRYEVCDLIKEETVNGRRIEDLFTSIDFESAANNGSFGFGFELDGLNLTQDLYHCHRCNYLEFDEKSFSRHLVSCRSSQKTSAMKIHCDNEPRNSPLTCFKCKTKHCSIQGLAVHFAMMHKQKITVKAHEYSLDSVYQMMLDHQARTVFDVELERILNEYIRILKQSTKENNKDLIAPVREEPQKPVDSSPQIIQTPFVFRKRRHNRLPQQPPVVQEVLQSQESGTKTRRRTQKTNLSPNPPEARATRSSVAKATPDLKSQHLSPVKSFLSPKAQNLSQSKNSTLVTPKANIKTTPTKTSPKRLLVPKSPLSSKSPKTVVTSRSTNQPIQKLATTSADKFKTSQPSTSKADHLVLDEDMDLDSQMDRVIEKIMAENEKEKKREGKQVEAEAMEVDAISERPSSGESVTPRHSSTAIKEDEDITYLGDAAPELNDRIDCLLCGSEQKSTAAFELHCLRHIEQIDCCPICALNNKTTSFGSIFGFFDHLFVEHFTQNPNCIQCPWCDMLCSKDVRSRRGIRFAISHILYECTTPKVCILCACTTNGAKRMVEPHKIHRIHEHKKVYNRFYCSRCLHGMHNVDQYKVHKCTSVAFRCCCDPWVEYRDQTSLQQHLDENVFKAHNLLPTRPQQDLNVIMNTRKQPVNSKSDDVYAFLKKYAFLRKPTKHEDMVGDEVDVKRKVALNRNFVDASSAQPCTSGFKLVGKSTEVITVSAPRPSTRLSTQQKPQIIDQYNGEDTPTNDEPRPVSVIAVNKSLQELQKLKRSSSTEIYDSKDKKEEKKGVKRRRTQPKQPEIEEPDLRKRKYSPYQLQQVMLFNQRSRQICMMDVKGKAEELGVENEDVVDVVEDLMATVCDKFMAAASGLEWQGKQLGQLNRPASVSRIAPLDFRQMMKDPPQVEAVPEKKTFKCMYETDTEGCKLVYDTFNDVQEHFYKEHGLYSKHPIPLDMNIYFCPICMSGVTDEGEFEIHLAGHENMKTDENFRQDYHWCVQCTLMCKSLEEYELHSFAHKQKKVTFICTQHLEAYDEPFNYYVHLEKHGKQVLKFCKMCGFANTSVRQVMTHIDKCTTKRFKLGEPLTRARMALGYCLASSALIRRLPNADFLEKVTADHVKFAPKHRCEHSFALFAQGGPLLTCQGCCTPISDLEWCKRFPDEAKELCRSKLKMVLNLSQTNGTPEQLGPDLRVIPRDPTEIGTGLLLQQCPVIVDPPACTPEASNVRSTTDTEEVWKRKREQKLITIDDDEPEIQVELPKTVPTPLVLRNTTPTTSQIQTPKGREVVINKKVVVPNPKAVYSQTERRTANKYYPQYPPPIRTYSTPQNYPNPVQYQPLPRNRVIINPYPRPHRMPYHPNPMMYRHPNHMEMYRQLPPQQWQQYPPNWRRY
ncbi:unnamed protein product [Bursaphelenchus okinawaensis]|uniref:C2H2-type domain-containing protein n=1 Tax=Bursaphelenchus okinawaensis TaxID=465554 RepID=A0A811JWC2_9BILA|nr:unnamed protein product [Bursaphelenchus okinawaensis]CAG9085330.1 unnamed protein product [Bursaphelenchus okinawaensis]